VILSFSTSEKCLAFQAFLHIRIFLAAILFSALHPITHHDSHLSNLSIFTNQQYLTKPESKSLPKRRTMPSFNTKALATEALKIYTKLSLHNAT
jgi:hypothetical protein